MRPIRERESETGKRTLGEAIPEAARNRLENAGRKIAVLQAQWLTNFSRVHQAP